ncbi:MAG: trypsin-like peptidase domain-containing protein, partial [Oscillospiraceae bacterium]|nr:trypsin-like peptidase domain-containing protein [Oscillospiraceae bacterium]
VLCCAIAGGGAGLGGAAAYSHLNRAPQNETTIYRNEVDPTAVNVKQADFFNDMWMSEIYSAYADSCVCISVQGMATSGWYQQPTSGAGSGFIISEDGYIVTNYHVIDGATAIRVTLNNGDSYDAKLVGGEELNDVAVLKIDGVSGLKPVVLGDSTDLVVGETVCTIGNALGTLSFSQTSGYVSSTGRSITMSDGTVMNNMIQTDCTINSGNSGGPLFDSYGRVVGITSAKLSNNGQSSQATIEGIGFAIPINDVIGIITDYMQYGYVTGRPYMGILEPRNISDYAQTFGWPIGVYVTGIDEDSCAQKAGLKPGDIITKIDDTEITDVNQMISVKNGYRAGDTVTLEVYRSGETITLSLTFDEQSNATTQGGSGNQGQVIPNNPAPHPTASGNNPGQYPYGDQNPYGGEEYEDFFNSFPWSYFFGR